MIAAIHHGRPSTQPHSVEALSAPGLVGFYFGCRVCMTFLFFQAIPQTGATVSVALNLLLLLGIAIYAFGPPLGSFRIALKMPVIKFVISFLALALLSLLWSETPSKVIALGYWSAMAADVFLVLLFARTDGSLRASESLLKGYVWGVVLLALVAWCAPTMPDLRLGDDEFLSPNTIGFACAVGTLLCQHFSLKAKHWKVLGIFLALTLLRGLSKTSILGFLVAEAFYLYRTQRIERAAKIKLAVWASVSILAFSRLIASYYTVYTNSGNQAETLTGRTSIWIVTLGLALENPWLGHGFHSFRGLVPAFGAFQPWHAHNELLQQFFTYGVIGVTLVSATYISFFRLCRRYQSHSFSLTSLSLLILVLVRALADTDRFELTFPLWALATVSLLLQSQEVEA